MNLSLAAVLLAPVSGPGPSVTAARWGRFMVCAASVGTQTFGKP